MTQGVTGVQRYAIEMVSSLANLQSHYQFVVVAPPGKLVSDVPNIIQDKFPFGGHLWEQLRLPWLVKKMRADLLWCPGNTAPLITFGVPMVLSLLDAAPFSGPEWFSTQFRTYYRILMPIVGRIASKIITISKFSRNELIQYNLVGKNNSIAVVYCGIIPLKARRGELAKRMATLQNKKYVLSLGSRDPRKNIARLLAAWNNIPENIKDGRVLALAGKADKVFSKEEIPTIPQGVLFLGYVSDDQLFDLYSQADAFVFPSIYEGFGLPPLEAMSCGTPVLVSHVTSLPEVCGDAALYCNPYDLDDISDKLIKVLTDKSLVIELRKRGIERAKCFSWEKSARQLVDIFDEVLYKKSTYDKSRRTFI